MKFQSDEEINYIYAGLLSHALPKLEWSHAAHFAAAIAMLKDKGLEAFEIMPETIKTYNVATGVQNTDTDGYHHTITLASLMAAQDFIAKAPDSMALNEIVNRLMRSKYGQPKWLLEYWTKGSLFSTSARRSWIAPDIQALPFTQI